MVKVSLMTRLWWSTMKRELATVGVLFGVGVLVLCAGAIWSGSGRSRGAELAVMAGGVMTSLAVGLALSLLILGVLASRRAARENPNPTPLRGPFTR